MHSTLALALLGLSTIASSHMIMKTPVPFAASKHANDNGPLKEDGSDFPCKFGYDTEGASNIMPLGSKQELAFIGGATHGGGSCQVSITYDSAPTANSVFKVIHSIEGGCPARNVAGNIGSSSATEDPDRYGFSIPESLPPGNAVLAWTWFNKVGNREMYMNCAPVTLTGPSAKQAKTSNETQVAKRDMDAYNALPNMFVANIGNGCKTKDNTDLKFDNPGQSVEVLSSNSLAGPVGNCEATAKTAASGTDSSAEPSPAAGAFFTASPEPKPAAAPEVEPEPKVAPVPASVPTSDSEPELQYPAAASNSSGDDYTPAESTVKQPSYESSDSDANSPKPPNSSPPNGLKGSIKAGDSCSNEGAWNCIEGRSYQRCASGIWSVSMPLAQGTTCTVGKGENIKIVPVKRSTSRIPRSHLRRHLNGAKFR
ncbi:hypothetical protein GcM3_030022 [Golovinomyces cichoracearum]|uniref:Spore coat protein SP96 n=1 Tax=Golovinomyces cichoracearum TaxID=62708 RepID=A0A420J505_9PEZI|nr:hypothetical protein GcM3_030022 [Golovinomyces cichoracearum]